MNSITLNANFRQRVVKKYDGTLDSLKDGSHKPKSHPNQHTKEEKKMILNHYPRYKNDLILLWYVPKTCISNGKKYYQYTAIDEFSRWTFRELYEEHSTYSFREFLIKLIQNCPFTIKRIQTDKGT